MNIETNYARLGDANIAYQVIGEGEIDFVYVPCWLSHLDRMWREPRFARFIERLASFGRVILFDKRGTGLSDPMASATQPSLDERMDDLQAVLDAAGSTRAVLFGTSLGGRLSALYAATYPERVTGLILLGSSPRGTCASDYPWAPSPEEHELNFEHVAQSWGGPVNIDKYATSLVEDQEFALWWAECLRSGGGPAAAVAMLRLEAESDIRPVLSSITTPTLVLHRQGDSVVNFEGGRYLAEQIPTARFVDLQGTDHLPFLGDQDALFGEIGRFVRDQLHALQPKRILATAVAVEFIGTREAAQRVGSGQWPASQTSLRTAIRSAMRTYRGIAAADEGDGFVAAFDAPSRAIHFAREIVDLARRHGLQARIGLETGTVELSDKTVGGLAAELATRIAAIARSGEVLLSGTLMGLVSGSGLRTVAVERDHVGLPPGLRLFRLADGVAGAASPKRAGAASFGRAADELSPREREVAFSVARGRSNREVGAELAISISTVERHVANILLKLGFRSRAQLSAWAASQQTSVGVMASAAAPLARHASYAAD
jgi:pimeloyl-ACP methyl ester carboxylesterase/DNA-binding CsgD family transcriptional regulator